MAFLDSTSCFAAPPQVIEVWSEGVPGVRPDASDERLVDGRVENVHRPTLTVYPPAPGAGTGVGVIVCPGGGYQRLRVFPDGGPDVAWLNRVGITAFVLRYRLHEYGQPAPLQDVLQSIRLVRSRATTFGLRPDRIGVHGTSAGGHLAACAGTLWDDPQGKGGSALDAVSARPDFQILVYSVVTMRPPHAHRVSRESLLGSSPSAELIERWSIESRVRKDSPPAFLVAASNDTSVPVENSLALYRAFRESGVPAELHVYATGVHGNSHEPAHGPTARWPERAIDWLRHHRFLPAAPPQQ